MAGASISPLALSAALVPVIGLAVASVVAAVRLEPPRRAVDPFWVVLAVEIAFAGAVLVVIEIIAGNAPLIELAIVASLGGVAAATWLERGAAGRGPGDDDGWGDDDFDDPSGGPDGGPGTWTDRDERAFREYARGRSRVPSLSLRG